MASLVNSSLDLIRRRKTSKHPRLHARWGDVSISAPTEGAWTQFDNPYQREKVTYGPGFVPGCSADEDYFDEEEASGREYKKTGPISVLKSRRLTRILSPSSLNTTTSKKSEEKERQIGFEYKPVRPDYAQEIAEEIDRQNSPRFRYVPASQKYLRDLVADLQPEENIQPPRSRSCEPSAGTGVTFEKQLQPQGVQEIGSNYFRGLFSSTMPRRSSRVANVAGVREEPRGRIKQKKKTASSLQRSQSAMKPHHQMTLTMVSDPDELW
ncbi:hypothetical protein VTN77DRAFT_4564 [Rasamsonia byssochlamydoides]|uniref:uncharacterized protein n=1 Tax=Rasamsonia byssochlamydoides TaxID=89139 RepID=UPI003741F0DA